MKISFWGAGGGRVRDTSSPAPRKLALVKQESPHNCPLEKTHGGSRSNDRGHGVVSRERPKYGHEVDSSEEGLGVQAIWVGMVHDSSRWSGSFSIKIQTHPDTYETGNNQCLCGEGPGTFPSLLKEMIEDTLEQPDEEVHRVGSGQIPSTGASVPIESGCTPSGTWMCSSTRKVFKP